MAQEWLTKYLRLKPEVEEIFDELEGYLEFCKKQGYVYDEAHLHNEKTPWGEWQRVKAGKPPRDNWSPYPKREWKPRNNNGTHTFRKPYHQR